MQFEHQVYNTLHTFPHALSESSFLAGLEEPDVVHVSCPTRTTKVTPKSLRDALKKFSVITPATPENLVRKQFPILRSLMAAFLMLDIDDLVFWFKPQGRLNNTAFLIRFRNMPAAGLVCITFTCITNNDGMWDYDPNVISWGLSYNVAWMECAEVFDLPERTPLGDEPQRKMLEILDMLRLQPVKRLMMSALDVLESTEETNRPLNLILPPRSHAMAAHDEGLQVAAHLPQPYAVKLIHSLQQFRPQFVEDMPELPIDNAGNPDMRGPKRKLIGGRAYHYLAGHYRHYKSGKIVWIEGHWRGDRGKPTIHKLRD